MFSLFLRAVPFLKKYALPLLAIGAMVFTYYTGWNHATDRCEAEEAQRIQRAYEQGFEIARQNAAFDREIVTVVEEVKNETPVDPTGNRLTDDGLLRLNQFLNSGP